MKADELTWLIARTLVKSGCRQHFYQSSFVGGRWEGTHHFSCWGYSTCLTCERDLAAPFQQVLQNMLFGECASFGEKHDNHTRESYVVAVTWCQKAKEVKMIMGDFPWQKRSKSQIGRQITSNVADRCLEFLKYLRPGKAGKAHREVHHTRSRQSLTSCQRSKQRRHAESFPQQYNQFPFHLLFGKWTRTGMSNFRHHSIM